MENIEAVHDEVLTHSLTLLKQAQLLNTLLAKPLHTHGDYRMFTRVLDSTTIVLGDTGPHKGVAMFEQWKVLEHLRQRNIPDKFNPAFTDTCAGPENGQSLNIHGGIPATPGSVVAGARMPGCQEQLQLRTAGQRELGAQHRNRRGIPRATYKPSKQRRSRLTSPRDR
jgi:hypothetical protein